MNLADSPQSIVASLNDLAVQPLVQFYVGLSAQGRVVFYLLLATAAALGFLAGRRRPTADVDVRRAFRGWRFPTFQNTGEALVSRALRSHFRPPDYHLMNHVTIRMDDGTTQVDHILVSRYGVFVIETKDYSGWIFGNASEPTWTQVFFHQKFKFQNPIFQNYRHVRAVQELLDFLPPSAIKSVVVFCGDAEFKTVIPDGVVTIAQLAEYLGQQREVVISPNRLQFCVGRLETTRLAISRETDVEHVQNVAQRMRGRAV